MKRVVKIGGRAQASPDLPSRIASAWQQEPGSFCVVHGGGDQISALQKSMGLEPSFVDGRRVTTREDLEVVRMVLSGLINKQLVSAFAAAGMPAVGISGEDGGLITATFLDQDRFGRVGKPVRANAEVLDLLLTGGYLPVISPLGSEDGNPAEALNVNGDDAAAAIAIAAVASELLLIADVTGVLDENKMLLPNLDASEADELAQSGVVNKGMKAKLQAGFAALAGGVARVRIANIDGLEDATAGTLLTFAQSVIT
ncbi:MAG TPA: acetylglutamate kinase [Gemmatimonadaceae bacterium]|nr:acetylglutamate kinase [Gemmatimonadaceae bacterium]